MAGGPRKTVFSTLARTTDRKEDRRIRQDTRSILIVLFTPREVKIKVSKQRKFSSLTSSISAESSYHQSQIFTKVARAIFWLCLSDLDTSIAGKEEHGGGTLLVFPTRDSGSEPFHYGLADVFP